MKFISNEIYQLFLKTILPASIVISMRLAAESRRKKINWAYAFTSFVIGLGSAFLMDETVRDSMSPKYATLTIVSIALASDKIMSWFLYRFKFDVIGDIIIEGLKGMVKRLFGL